jgi:hypothetical protein
MNKESIRKLVLTVFKEEREASTDYMDRWGVLNRAFDRIHDYMKSNTTEYEVKWNGTNLVTIKYGDNTVEVDLNETI